MLRNVLVLSAAVCLVWGASPADGRAAGPRPRKPNIIVILADDMGFGDIGVNGCKDIKTPHIDSLARNGMRFRQGYVSAPQCSPTRAGLLTGRYQQRFGHESNAATVGSAMSPGETTLADRLRALGYVTGVVGKWHLGLDAKSHPLGRGFQEFFGFLGGAHAYVGNDKPGILKNNPILRGKEPVPEKEYLTDAFAREAVGFIDRHRQKPFFLYLAFNAPHGPLQAPDKYLKRVEHVKDPTRRTYAAMVTALDDAVGAVLAKLRDSGLEEETLIFFLSDNGGPLGSAWNGSSNFPLRGQKGDLLEGGVRVPFLVQWRGRLPAGKVYDHPVIQLDILPTALAAAGARARPEWKLDGVDLLPHLTGKNQDRPHETLFWRFHFPPRQEPVFKWAVRQGDWKLVKEAERHPERGFTGKTWLRLYNLATDPGEMNDLSAKEPARVKRLEALWQRWNAEMAPPPLRRARETSGERGASAP
ncbi:MAG: sulfatase [Gemmataceae bacterium]|nr:sulfatase [Gemmataceae bacterium]